MKTCVTCKHWSASVDDWEFEELGVRDCKGILMREDIKELAHKDHDDDRWEDAGQARENAAMRATRAFVVDGSGYYAALRTHPDFGCVLHEPPPPEGDGR